MKQFVFIVVLITSLLLSGVGIYSQTNVSSGHKPPLNIIQEVLQTTKYTYLRVKADTTLKWLAVPSADFKAGDTCYYQGGLVMPEFKSKELDRTFDKVIFLEGVSKTPEGIKKPGMVVPEHGVKTKPGKLEVKIDPAEGGITIAELFQNKDSYNGKVVKIRGQVVKFKPAIMGKNWAHLQDGTSFAEKYDLTATLSDTLTVGNIVTLESKVTTNKDFGSGYFFEVILEDAKVK